MNIVDAFVSKLNDAIRSFPVGFYDSFDYTCTGNNHTHPKTIGIIVKILWETDGVSCVSVDMRLNQNGKKFQPDVYACTEKDEPLLMVDYESPNSSDARIPTKDVIPYLDWDSSVPYVVITTLPKRKCPHWELRYTSSGYTNHKHKHKINEIRQNPFEYWYGFYQKELNKHADKTGTIHFVNIDSKKAEIVRLF